MWAYTVYLFLFSKDHVPLRYLHVIYNVAPTQEKITRFERTHPIKAPAHRMVDPKTEIKTKTKNTTRAALSWDDLHRLNQMSCCSSNITYHILKTHPMKTDRQAQTPCYSWKLFIIILFKNFRSALDVQLVHASNKSTINVVHMTCHFVFHREKKNSLLV